MLKKIQQRLLLRHPLLWNIRIIPLMGLMLTLHIIFYVCGYLNGNVDFTPYNSEYFGIGESGTATLFSVLLSLLIFVGWLFFYLRNNAFKSFYPAGAALYKEWLCLLVICITNISYIYSYNAGYDSGVQSYMPEDEFARRIEILSMASVFTDNPKKDDGLYYEKTNYGTIPRQRDWMLYNNHKYSLKSLYNRQLTSYMYSGTKKDSIIELRVKGWLEANRKDSVHWVMHEFEKIVKSHNQQMPLPVSNWLRIVYNFPSFSPESVVAKQYKFEEGEDLSAIEYTATGAIDTVTASDTHSYRLEVVDGKRYYYAKYYVPMRQMENAYQKIASSYTSPKADLELFEILTITGLMLSLFLFSFRVTSGREWLLAAVGVGITGIVCALFMILADKAVKYNDFPLFVMFWLILLTGLFFYFYSRNFKKGRSGIALNILLWLSYWILPAVNGAILSLLPKKEIDFADGATRYEYTPYEEWMQSHESLFTGLCLLVFLLFMFFFTRSIVRWKGIAEA